MREESEAGFLMREESGGGRILMMEESIGGKILNEGGV
jgi:hypothetical protein